MKPDLLRRCVSAAIAMLATGPAVAATAGTTADLEEIVVTATKRAERLLDVPSAISTLDASTLETLGVRSFDDYAGLVPGISQRSFGAPGAGTVIIRGLNTGPQQTTATTGFYLDDTPFTASGALSIASLVLPDADLADVERIEVLKGPQGTLYGATALGGLVRIVSKRPDLQQFSGSVGASARSVTDGGTGYGARGTVNLPVVTDRVGVRLTGFHRREPGFTSNVDTGSTDVNEATVSGARLAVLARLGDGVELRVNGLYQKIDADGFAAMDTRTDTLEPLYGERKFATYYDTGSELEIRSIGATLDWNLGPGTLTAFAGLNDYETLTTADYTPVYGPLLAAFLPPGSGIAGVLEPGSKKTTFELRYASRRIGRFEFLAGVFHTGEDNLYPVALKGEFTATRQPLPSVLGNLLTQVTDSSYDETAVFGNATFYFTDAFDLTLGARHGENEQDATLTTSGLLRPPGRAPVTSFTLDDDSTTYLATLRWRPTDNVSTFLRAASGYRPGGPQTNPAAPIGAYDPDTVWNYEIGFKSSLLDRRLDLSASAFRIDWKDIQLNTLVGGFLLIGNGGEARVNGFEVELAARPVESLSLGLSAGYTDAEITKIGASESAQLGAVAGDSLPLTAKWTAAALADWNVPLSERLDAALGATLRYTGSRPTSYSRDLLNPSITLPAETVLDLRAGLRFGSLSAQLRVENATDEEGYASFGTSKLFPGQPVPSSATLIRPRSYVISVDYSF